MMNKNINIIREVDQLKFVSAIACDVDKVVDMLQIKQNNFTLITQNIRSVYCNFNDFTISLLQLKCYPDIIILTECWLSDHKPTPIIPNYVSYCSSRYFNKSDGVIAYIKDIHSAEVNEIYLQDASALQIQIDRTTIIGIYRSPSVNSTDGFIQSLDCHLETLKTHGEIIITGDININIICNDGYDQSSRSNYLNMLSTHGIIMGHDLPTRGCHSLDHIMLKINNNVVNAQIAVLNTTVTDHAMVLLQLSGCRTKFKCRKTKTSTDYEKALCDLKTKNLNELLFCKDPEVVAKLLISSISETLKANTSSLPIPKNKRVIKPWITPGILKCIRNRNKMQKKLRSNPFNEILLITYRRYRNFCTKLIKKLKRDYERQLLRDTRKNAKGLWDNIAKITNFKKSKYSTSKLLNVRASGYESANFVNTYFSNVGKRLADAMAGTCVEHDFDTPSQLSSFVLFETDEDEIHTTLMNLKTSSAPGHDNIPTHFLKMAKTELVPILTHLVNLCFDSGTFPSLLKESLITPIYKGGDEGDVGNYRPISVLPSISKILEKLINKRLLKYLDKFNILSESQFGFRTGRSTEDAVAALTSVVADSLDNKTKCLAVFLDLKKAFDTVSLPILVHKLERLGIRDSPLKLLTSFVSGRLQRVKLGQTMSDFNSIDCGVPQGSVLGPTLFLIYINDLCNMTIPYAKVFSYADDTAVVFTGDSWREVKAHAENGLRKVAQWLNANLLTLNTAKTNFISFAINDRFQPETSFLIKIHSCDLANTNNPDQECSCPAIEKVQTTKYLGVMLDQRLNWYSHIDLVAGRLRKLIWIFKELRYIADKKLLNGVYIALAQSITIYCITLWGGALKTKFLEVERAQRALLKVMYFKRRIFPTLDLYRIADLLTVRKLYILHNVLKVHKSLGFYPDKEQRRRKDNVAPVTFVHTRFAQHQYTYLSSHIYNKINKAIQIYSLTTRQCKVKLSTWIKCLDYNETENILSIYPG